MIAKINEMLLDLGSDNLKAMRMRCERAFQILDLVNAGLVTPTSAAYTGPLAELEKYLIARTR